MQTMTQANAYEIDRVTRSREARDKAARRAEREAFSADRDHAIALGAKAGHIEAKVAEFDRPESGMRDEVRAARKWRSGMLVIGAVLVFAAVGDFLFGTPELVEPLANKLASLVMPVPELTDATGSMDEAPRVAPVAIRVVCGITFSLFCLLVTLLMKRLASINELLQAVSRLVPGDDEGYRRIQRSIWLRRSVVLPYIALVVVFFGLCYSTDLQKARDLVAIRHNEQSVSGESMEWNELGLELSGSGELKTDEATPASSQPEAMSYPVDLEHEARMIARPQILIYSLLACAHCLVFLMPLGEKPDDTSLASFNRSRAAKQAQAMRHEEERIIRDLYSRIREADPDMRDTLIVEASPVARKINEVLGGGDFIEVPDAPVSHASTATPDSPDAFAARASQEPQTPPINGANPTHNEPDDPLKAIFG
jgi:hypothetical protein